MYIHYTIIRVYPLNYNTCISTTLHVYIHYTTRVYPLHYTFISTTRNIHHTRHLLFLLLRDSSLNSHDHQLKKHYMSDLQCNPLSLFSFFGLKMRWISSFSATKRITNLFNFFYCLRCMIAQINFIQK